MDAPEVSVGGEPSVAPTAGVGGGGAMPELRSPISTDGSVSLMMDTAAALGAMVECLRGGDLFGANPSIEC